jgi:outer membrane protein assembly factor BamB
MDTFSRIIYVFLTFLVGCSSPTEETVTPNEAANIILQEQIYINDIQGTVYALNAKDGKENWKVNFEDEFFGSLTVNEGYGYLGRSNMGFIAFTLKDQKLHWSHIVYNGSLSTPLIIKDKLYFGVDNNILYQVNKSTGKVLWSFEDENFGKFHYVVENENSIFATTDLSFLYTLYSLNPANGKVNWSVQTETEVIANPIFYKDLVVTLDFAGNVTAYNKNNGDLRWRYLASYNTNPANLILQNDQILLSAENGIIYCLNASNGVEKWKLNVGVEISPSLNLSHNFIFYSTKNGELIAYDSILRKTIWVYKYGSGIIKTIPTIHNNTVYFASPDKVLHAVELEKGTMKWTYTCLGSVWGSPSVVTKEGKVIRGFGDIDETK